MKKKLTRMLIMSIILCMLSTVDTFSAETEGIYNIIIQEDRGTPYVSTQLLDADHINLVYPNAVTGCNYSIAVLTERAKPSNTNIVFLDQKKAQGNSISFDIYSNNMNEGQYYIFMSSDADKGIIRKTEVASFFYGRPVLDIKIPSAIIVKKRPQKTVYEIGEQLDLNGIVITVIYSDGSTDEITYDGSNISFSGFNSSNEVRQQRVTVTYQSLETAFTVDIIQPKTETTPKEKISLNQAEIFGIKNNYSYTKNAICPIPIVKINTNILREGTDYDVSYENNKNAGTAFIIITGKGTYTDSIIKKFSINPIANKITVSKTKFKASTLKKKAQKAKIRVLEDNGKMTFKYPKKHISISKKGVITVKKRTPKGTYRIKVTVAAKKNFKKTVKTFKIIVK